MVPKVLTPEQKQAHMLVAETLLNDWESNDPLLSQIITDDESWVFEYDPSTKHQTMQWKILEEPQHKKAKMSCSQQKAMMIVFFDIHGVVMMEWVSHNCNVNPEFDVKTLRKLRKCIRKNRPELWNAKSFAVHHDNAPSRSLQVLKKFLEKIICSSFRMPLFSRFDPLRFFSFSKSKINIEGATSGRSGWHQTKLAEYLQTLTTEDFQRCFNDWEIHLRIHLH